MISLVAETALCPLDPKLITVVLLQLVLAHDMRLANQARQVREALRRVAGAAANESFGGPLVATYVARLAFRRPRATLNRLIDGILVFLVGVILLRAAAPFDPLT